MRIEDTGIKPTYPEFQGRPLSTRAFAITYSLLDSVLSIQHQVLAHASAQPSSSSPPPSSEGPTRSAVGGPSVSAVFGAQPGGDPVVENELQIIADFAELVLLDQASPKPANWQELTTALWKEIQNNFSKMPSDMQALLKPLLTDQPNPYALVQDWTGRNGGLGIATEIYNNWLPQAFNNPDLVGQTADNAMRIFLFQMSCMSDPQITASADKQFWGFSYSSGPFWQFSTSANFVPFVVAYYWQKDGGNNAQFQTDINAFMDMMPPTSTTAPNYSSIYQSLQNTLSTYFTPGQGWPWDGSPADAIYYGLGLFGYWAASYSGFNFL